MRPLSIATFLLITEEEAKKFTIMNVLSGTDGWLPTDYTKQAVAPTARLDDKTISWNTDDQVRCYVIFKDNEYITNTTETFFTADADGIYTIYSANEMGGLSSEYTTVTIGQTAIEQVEAENAKSSKVIYNIAGQRVDDNYKGIIIKNGKKQFCK